MLVIILLLADGTPHFDAVDIRRVMFEYCYRWAVSRDERSRFFHARENLGVNALGSNGLGKGGCQLCVRDTEKHGPLGQRRLDGPPGLELFVTTHRAFHAGRCYFNDVT